MFWKKCLASIVLILTVALFIAITHKETDTLCEITYLKNSDLMFEYILPKDVAARIHELCNQTDTVCKHVKYGAFKPQDATAHRARKGHYFDMTTISHAWTFGYLEGKTQYNILNEAIRLSYERD